MNKSTYKIPLAPPSRATLLSTIQLPPTPLPVRRRCYRNSGWLINRRARNGDPIGLQAYSVEAPQRQARRRWAGFPKEPVECELVGPLLPSHLFFHLLLYLLRLLLYLLLPDPHYGANEGSRHDSGARHAPLAEAPAPDVPVPMHRLPAPAPCQQM